MGQQKRQYIIRMAEQDDLAMIAAIERRANPMPWRPSALASSLQDALSAEQRMALRASGMPRHQFLVLQETSLIDVHDEPIVAYLIALNVADEANLLHIAVDVNLRQQGCADELLTYWLAQLGAARQQKTVWLEVRHSNLAAQSLYEKHGFARVSVRKNYYHIEKQSIEKDVHNDVSFKNAEPSSCSKVKASSVAREDALIYRRFI